MGIKAKIVIFLVIILLVIGLVVYFSYFFNAPRKGAAAPGTDAGAGRDLTVTIFGHDGKIIKRWTGMKRAPAKDAAGAHLFISRDRKTVQISNAVWFIAEEE